MTAKPGLNLFTSPRSVLPAAFRSRVLGGALAIQMLSLPSAFAINKCEVEGRVVYQDTPCAADAKFFAREKARKENLEALHRKLDHLAALGYGMVREKPADPPAPEAASDQGPQFYVPQRKRSYDEKAAEWERKTAELNERARANNVRSAAALTRAMDNIQAACGGRLVDDPKVGMSDEDFRNCTRQGRFGGATQVVTGTEGGMPLRLYIFPNVPRRVYSVDGTITAVKP